MDPGKEFYAAFLKAQKELRPAKKNSVNPHFRSKFANLEACYEACLDALNRHGLVLKQDTFMGAEEGTYLYTDIVHVETSQKTRSVLYVGPKTFKAQEEGSALTYKRRYGLVTAVGLATEDDDGNAASKKEEPAAEKIYDGSAKQVEYTIPFGKYKDCRIEDVSTLPNGEHDYSEAALKGYIKFIKDKAGKTELSGDVREFIELAESYLYSTRG